MTVIVWLAPMLWPLLSAGLVVTVGRHGRPGLVAGLVATGPVPALLLAMLGSNVPPVAFPWLLLGLQLELQPAARVLLVMTALVWTAGGVAAKELVAARWSTGALWLLALAGNVGLVLAADLVSLYVLYAVMTFAAYGLVVHDRSPAARRAGRVYIVMAVVGEALLISGLMLAAGEAGAVDTRTVAAAIAAAEPAKRDLMIGLLTAGFAVKAGVVPLHVWLPLAHPAAPVPASAVLSGAMIKAGLVGWLAVLPLGILSAPEWSAVLISAGLVSALGAAVIGVLQDRPKVVLAYSSVSQMGLITVLVGVGIAAVEVAPFAVGAAVTYALHHAMAKGALFLGVGVRSVWPGRRGRRAVLLGTVLAGVSLAGAPLTSGWVAKAAMKRSVGLLETVWAGRLTTLLAVAAIGTTLLMARVVVLLARPTPAEQQAAVARTTTDPGGVLPVGLLAGWIVLLLGTLVATWFVAPGWVAEVATPRLYVRGMVDAAWPVLVGVLLTFAAIGYARGGGDGVGHEPRVPAGDLVVLAAAAAPALSRLASDVVRRVGAGHAWLAGIAGSLESRLRPGEGFAHLDVVLRRWQVAGVLFALVAAALLVTLAPGP